MRSMKKYVSNIGSCYDAISWHTRYASIFESLVLPTPILVWFRFGTISTILTTRCLQGSVHRWPIVLRGTPIIASMIRQSISFSFSMTGVTFGSTSLLSFASRALKGFDATIPSLRLAVPRRVFPVLGTTRLVQPLLQVFDLLSEILLSFLGTLFRPVTTNKKCTSLVLLPPLLPH